MGSMNKPSVVLLLFLSLFLFSAGNVVEVEGAWCSTPSRRFAGACFRNANCANVCATEGWPSGICDSFRCMCRKRC
ncbi:hypothetical protein QJS04_geneDACA018895 [Acorus gramineus]|uniref:Knottins-like domain-containing protein n=1 Tax=Acorus gramineus TaxID=55184 RepID=A0AAV9AEF7_ACOGR|nr:hypothetical protein QJS04_geneDACA018895 [Acorus gramineus]